MTVRSPAWLLLVAVRVCTQISGRCTCGRSGASNRRGAICRRLVGRLLIGRLRVRRRRLRMLTSLACRGRVSGSVVVIGVHSACPRSSLGIASGVLRLVVAVVGHDRVALLDEVVVALRSQRLAFVLLECRETDLLLARHLASFPVRLRLNGLQTHLLGIAAIRCGATHLPIGPTGPPADAAAAETVEAPGKEEEDPRGESKPDGDAELRLAAIDRIDARLGEEEEDEIEDEGDHGDSGRKAGNTCAAVGHGHLTDMGKEAEDGGDGC